MLAKVILYVLALGVVSLTVSAETTKLRIGVQASGTAEWELAELASTPHPEFELDKQTLASPEAGKIALQSGGVDMIVSDWLWVNRQRASGMELTFYPYSDMTGALLVKTGSPIHTLSDLSGKKLGIAGGELDKNWLLLQALAQKQGIALANTVEKIYAAPPLLNEQIKQGRIDAILTYWNFAAKLEAQGYKVLLTGKEIQQGLGISESVPSLGYVFKQSWAKQHTAALQSFFAAAHKAKDHLCTDDKAWQKILPLTLTDDVVTQQKLRQRYCEGRVEQWGAAQQQAAQQIYKVLHETSHGQLTGSSEHLQTDTFWTQP
ncbi:ABC transporter substrate-binding protein [Methylocucumis oryzae]|uniref:ABC transporter substrate-binding protein n=2 Tax=Methylocucumis oryzae TaxID=1632867 RepID=A0A0F3IRC6_9GAMM|nr:ABC transporter substrate-binding protein [Methylocucumis oryzae]